MLRPSSLAIVLVSVATLAHPYSGADELDPRQNALNAFVINLRTSLSRCVNTSEFLQDLAQAESSTLSNESPEAASEAFREVLTEVHGSYIMNGANYPKNEKVFREFERGHNLILVQRTLEALERHAFQTLDRKKDLDRATPQELESLSYNPLLGPVRQLLVATKYPELTDLEEIEQTQVSKKASKQNPVQKKPNLRTEPKDPVKNILLRALEGIREKARARLQEINRFDQIEIRYLYDLFEALDEKSLTDDNPASAPAQRNNTARLETLKQIVANTTPMATTLALTEDALTSNAEIARWLGYLHVLALYLDELESEADSDRAEFLKKDALIRINWTSETLAKLLSQLHNALNTENACPLVEALRQRLSTPSLSFEQLISSIQSLSQNTVFQPRDCSVSEASNPTQDSSANTQTQEPTQEPQEQKQDSQQKDAQHQKETKNDPTSTDPCSTGPCDLNRFLGLAQGIQDPARKDLFLISSLERWSAHQREGRASLSPTEVSDFELQVMTYIGGAPFSGPLPRAQAALKTAITLVNLVGTVDLRLLSNSPAAQGAKRLLDTASQFAISARAEDESSSPMAIWILAEVFDQWSRLEGMSPDAASRLEYSARQMNDSWLSATTTRQGDWNSNSYMQISFVLPTFSQWALPDSYQGIQPFSDWKIADPRGAQAMWNAIDSIPSAYGRLVARAISCSAIQGDAPGILIGIDEEAKKSQTNVGRQTRK